MSDEHNSEMRLFRNAGSPLQLVPLYIQSLVFPILLLYQNMH